MGEQTKPLSPSAALRQVLAPRPLSPAARVAAMRRALPLRERLGLDVRPAPVYAWVTPAGKVRGPYRLEHALLRQRLEGGMVAAMGD